MTTALITHPASQRHETPRGHPERVERILAVQQALAALPGLMRLDAPAAGTEAVTRCHPLDHVRALASLVPHEDEEVVALDADTTMSSGSWEAALRAAGGACLAVDTVMTGAAHSAFVAARPPGHHAEPRRAMGFCLLNTAAIAARHAQARHGAERVAIVDFDVHHGNGTQAIAWDDASLLYASTHQMPLYPGTGAASETGAHGTIVNAPLRPGDDGGPFREAFVDTILLRLEAFGPDLVVVSAGFDAHRRDPLGGLALVEDDFAWVTDRLMGVAARCCRGRLVSVLEGGYDLQALAASAAAHVAVLSGALRTTQAPA